MQYSSKPSDSRHKVGVLSLERLHPGNGEPRNVLASLLDRCRCLGSKLGLTLLDPRCLGIEALLRGEHVGDAPADPPLCSSSCP